MVTRARQHPSDPEHLPVEILMAHSVVMATILLSFLVACSPPSRDDAGWAQLSEAEQGTRTEQRTRADEARQLMYGRLMQELSAAIEADGYGAAIEVCAERAPAIAREVAAETGVRIGRTSFARRNPDNSPPAWAASSVRQKLEVPAAFGHIDGRYGALTPIRIAGACLACHGRSDQLAPGVSEALATRYPQDQATGFRDGDLRGWFWVEVAAR